MQLINDILSLYKQNSDNNIIKVRSGFAVFSQHSSQFAVFSQFAIRRGLSSKSSFAIALTMPVYYIFLHLILHIFTCEDICLHTDCFIYLVCSNFLCEYFGHKQNRTCMFGTVKFISRGEQAVYLTSLLSYSL